MLTRTLRLWLGWMMNILVLLAAPFTPLRGNRLGRGEARGGKWQLLTADSLFSSGLLKILVENQGPLLFRDSATLAQTSPSFFLKTDLLLLRFPIPKVEFFVLMGLISPKFWTNGLRK